MTLILATILRAQPTIELKRGLVITRSVRIAPKTYRFAGGDSAVITIRGSNLVVDFAGATLEGLEPGADPEQAAGVGIRIDGGRDVEVRNARVRGYKVGLIARGTRRLTLARNDFSYNWKPQLFSVMEHESLVDWLSHHKTEHDEWLRFGAGVYLADVRGGDVRDNRIVQGMEGLMMVRTDSMRVWNNVIEFNSGVGIGMYRSSHNTIMHNRASYNVRGYSHGFFRRGQDSADLLMYEQSSNNVVAYNSMTHGGDGLFLWAGQSTMDTGKGGANDNLFYGNDFSFAPTNGMEATFSRNTFVKNRVEGSDYGLWGGYSFDSKVVDNDFVKNRVGVAIEHGQNNLIGANRFTGDSTAIYLWANAIEPSDWGYPKYRDTQSRGYVVGANSFRGNRVGLRLANTTGQSLENMFSGVDSQIVRRDSSTFPDMGLGQPRLWSAPPPKPIAGAIDAIASDTLGKRDRSAIIVDEWGPYDYRSPKLWPIDTVRKTVRLRVLGPEGTWRIASRRGVSAVSSERGKVGDTLTLTTSGRGETSVILEYRGNAVVSPRGERTPAGRPYYFSYERFEPSGTWDVRFFAWADTSELRNIATIASKPPLATERRDRIDYFWYRPTIAGLPQEKWAATATGSITLGSGSFSVRTISDDAVRVYIDGALAIDNWKPHESEVDYAPISAGRHDVRVEYVQVGGWTELRLDVVRGAPRSKGSPGPH
jgi:parallel beta-helix repeat protein